MTQRQTSPDIPVITKGAVTVNGSDVAGAQAGPQVVIVFPAGTPLRKIGLAKSFARSVAWQGRSREVNVSTWTDDTGTTIVTARRLT